jgi:hypothetical protein
VTSRVVDTPPPFDPPDVAGGLVYLCLERMAGLLAVDETSLVATLQTGMRWDRAESLLARRGLTLGPLPGVLKRRTVAESIAANDRLRPSAAFGQVLDNIQGLTAVLPGGARARTVVAPRRATGPELTAAVFGTQHRGALVTEVSIQIWRRSGETTRHACAVADWTAAETFVRACLRVRSCVPPSCSPPGAVPSNSVSRSRRRPTRRRCDGGWQTAGVMRALAPRRPRRAPRRRRRAGRPSCGPSRSCPGGRLAAAVDAAAGGHLPGSRRTGSDAVGANRCPSSSVARTLTALGARVPGTPSGVRAPRGRFPRPPFAARLSVADPRRLICIPSTNMPRPSRPASPARSSVGSRAPSPRRRDARR